MSEDDLWMIQSQGWVRRTERPDEHRCSPPMRTLTFEIPPPPPPPSAGRGWKPSPPGTWSKGVPDGEWNDLWACVGCGKLWRVGNSCDDCDPHRPRGICVRGIGHVTGYVWRPARFWQRLRHRRWRAAA